MNTDFDDKQFQAFLEQVIQVQLEHFRAAEKSSEKDRRDAIKRFAIDLVRKRQGKRS